MKKMAHDWSRRQFLNKLGALGGSALVYESMLAMDLMGKSKAWDGPPKLPPNKGNGQSVLILGAGIGGLTTAYLLSRAGYRCEILEASNRAGGRNHTARRGSTVIEENNGKTTVQQCKFDNDLYLNLGPGRIPYHHRRVLSYCQELNVVLEPYVMNTTANLYHSSKGLMTGNRPYRQIQNDTRGYIAELLAKSIKEVDTGMTNEDMEKMLSLLSKFGVLDKNYKYKGTTRGGCTGDTPSVANYCNAPSSLQLRELLDANFWEHSFYDRMEYEWQETLFEPKGGMDMIVEGFLREVGDLITYNAPVTDIKVKDNEVLVTYMDGNDKRKKTADYCISNMPCPILQKLDTNFKGEFETAVNTVSFADSCKVGWQCNERFWESDKYQIYGGISWTDNMIEQIWYPSSGYFGQKGTLTGAYIHNQNAKIFGNYDLAKRLAVAKKGGAELHDEFNNDTIVPTDLGMSIAWQHVTHQKGAWTNWHDDNEEHHKAYARLLEPYKNRFFITGDQVSTLPGWQEGAMMSAEHVVSLIGGMTSVDDLPDNIKAPNSIKVIQGLG